MRERNKRVMQKSRIEYMKEYRKKNYEKLKEWSRQYQKTYTKMNKDKVYARQKKWRESHPEYKIKQKENNHFKRLHKTIDLMLQKGKQIQ